MKLSVQQKELHAALGRVKSAVPNKSPLPILLCVRLGTAHGALTIDATDLELAIATTCPAMVEDEGQVCIPYALLAQIVASLPDDRVAVMLDATSLSLTLECGKYTTRIHGREVEDFPPMPASDESPPVLVLPSAEVVPAVALTAFAASKDESRPCLTGVLIETHASTVRLVAADGFRMSITTIPMEAQPDPVRLLVPARALTTVTTLAGKEDCDIAITMDGTKAVFDVAGHRLVSRTIADKFPDFEKVIPTEWTNRAIATREELLRATKLATVFARSSQNICRMDMTPNTTSGGTVRMAANANESGDSTATLTGVQQGTATAVAVNISYLQEVVAAIPNYQVELRTQGADYPLVVQALGNDMFLHIIMPMTLR